MACGRSPQSDPVRSSPAAADPFACKLEQDGITHDRDADADKRIWHAPAQVSARMGGKLWIWSPIRIWMWL